MKYGNRYGKYEKIACWSHSILYLYTHVYAKILIILIIIEYCTYKSILFGALKRNDCCQRMIGRYVAWTNIPVFSLRLSLVTASSWLMIVIINTVRLQSKSMAPMASPQLPDTHNILFLYQTAKPCWWVSGRDQQWLRSFTFVFYRTNSY